MGGPLMVQRGHCIRRRYYIKFLILFCLSKVNLFEIVTCGWQKILILFYFLIKVQIRVRLQCQPLLESQFKHIIGDNYYNQHHFWFELDHAQTSKLVSLLASLAVAPGTSVQNTMKWRSIFPASSSHDTRKEIVEFPPLALEAEHSNQLSQRSDSTDVLSSFDGENQPLEARFNVEVDQQEEKDYIYMKLRELAIKQEVNGEHQDLSLPCDARDNAIPNCTNLEMCDVKNTSVINDISSKDKGYPGELLGVEDNNEQNPGPSSEYKALIIQVD